MKKRGQLKLSFGMIFGIILMIIFIAFAVYGTSKFLSMNKNVQVESFKKDLQTDVNNLWRLGGSDSYTYYLPKKIIKVCFEEDEYNNLRIVYDKAELNGNIEHLNLNGQTTCIPLEDGKLQLILKKDLGEHLVSVEQVNVKQ